jgi:hypothetical protein
MKPYEVDTLGFHPKEERDYTGELIDGLFANMKTTTLQLIELNKAKREKHEAGVLWPKFFCPILERHGKQ